MIISFNEEKVRAILTILSKYKNIHYIEAQGAAISLLIDQDLHFSNAKECTLIDVFCSPYDNKWHSLSSGNNWTNFRSFWKKISSIESDEQFNYKNFQLALDCYLEDNLAIKSACKKFVITKLEIESVARLTKSRGVCKSFNVASIFSVLMSYHSQKARKCLHGEDWLNKQNTILSSILDSAILMKALDIKVISI